MINVPLGDIIGCFGDESFQVISCTGTVVVLTTKEGEKTLKNQE